MLDLAVAVFSYASDFFGSDDRPSDLPEVKRGESKSRADSFLSSPSTIKDLTGAGDLFASGFLNGYVNNKSLKDSLQNGTEMAAKVIQIIGARLS